MIFTHFLKLLARFIIHNFIASHIYKIAVPGQLSISLIDYIIVTTPSTQTSNESKKELQS